MSLFDKRLLIHTNWSLLICMLLLFTVGVLNLYSAGWARGGDSSSVALFYQKQLLWGLLSFTVMLGTLFIDYHQLRTLAWPLFFLTVILLLAVFGVGKVIYGARRWISLGLFNIQPSEFAKYTILILGARLLARDGEPLGWLRLGQVLCMGLIPAGLIFLQPDLGTALNCLLLLGSMILFHGVKAHVLKICMIAVPCLLPLGWMFMHDYQKQRVLTFLDPGNDPLGSGYHIIQSQITIGSGQLWGKGFLESTQGQLRFLPERHTDFALAIFGEEWGFVGCLALLTLFCLFLLNIFQTVVMAKDRFGSTLAAGVFFYFFWQILINMGMVVGIMPVVGIPLPFISYGGSALLTNLILTGLVFNVSMRRFMFKG